MRIYMKQAFCVLLSVFLVFSTSAAVLATDTGTNPETVIGFIDAIGTVTDESGPAINKARDAYDALSDEQKALVTNYAVLVAAEESCEDIQAARHVDELIKMIDIYKVEEAFYTAQAAYDALTVDQKVLVRYYDILDYYKYCVPSPLTYYYKVIHLIENIGTVTDESGTAINTARDAYDALPDGQKSKVTNYTVLVAAEKAYKDIQAAGDVEALIEAFDSEKTLDSYNEAKIAYDVLTEDQKILVRNYNLLIDYFPPAPKLDYLIDPIDSIGTVTDESGPAIKKAREWYDMLTDEQKALVTNYWVLVDAEKAYGDILAARTVEALIEAFDSEKTLDSYNEAKIAYDVLTEDQKMLVRNYNLLIDNFPPAPMPDYLIVIDLIDSIGTVTDESGPAINKARDAYDALSDEQKALVTNYCVLVDAEKAYGDIQAARTVEALIEKYDSDKKMELYKEAEEAYEVLTEDQKMLVRNYNLLIDNFPPAPMPGYLIVIDLIDSIGTVTDESGPAINKARDAYDALSDEQKALVTNYAVLVAAEESCEDIQAARDVEALIEAFIEVKDSEDKIDSYKAAETAYDALTEEQKMLVRNYDVLRDYFPPAPMPDYLIVIDLIDSIGTVTDESGPAINKACEAYDMLTDEQKAMITNYSILVDAEKAYEELISSPMYGDTNSDGKVTAADALLALQHAVNKIILTGNQFTAADFDGNGVITAADALSILKYSLITLSEFPVEITE